MDRDLGLAGAMGRGQNLCPVLSLEKSKPVFALSYQSKL